MCVNEIGQLVASNTPYKEAGVPSERATQYISICEEILSNYNIKWDMRYFNYKKGESDDWKSSGRKTKKKPKTGRNGVNNSQMQSDRGVKKVNILNLPLQIKVKCSREF